MSLQELECLVGLPLPDALARCPALGNRRIVFTVAPRADHAGCTPRVIALRDDYVLAGWFRDHVTTKENAQ